MRRRRAFAFVAVGLGAAVRAACPAHCNFRGYCSAPDATLSTSFCICQPGVTGAACEQIHCPRGDDPFTGTAIDPSGVQRNALGEPIFGSDFRPMVSDNDQYHRAYW